MLRRSTLVRAPVLYVRRGNSGGWETPSAGVSVICRFLCVFVRLVLFRSAADAFSRARGREPVHESVTAVCDGRRLSEDTPSLSAAVAAVRCPAAHHTRSAGLPEIQTQVLWQGLFEL